MCWHEAGHVWQCWKTKVRIDRVSLRGVLHAPFPDPGNELRQAMAGSAAIAIHRNWPFEMAFLFGGAIGSDANGGDPRDALEAAFKFMRPGAKKLVLYDDEIEAVYTLMRRAYQEVFKDMGQAQAWSEVTAIANALLKALPDDTAQLSGDDLARAIGKTAQF